MVVGPRTRQRAQVTGDGHEPPESVHTERDVQAAYARHGGDLFGFALNALGDRHLAEEVVQETFVNAWRAAHSFDPGRGTLRTWLFAIARNMVVDVTRRRAVHAHVRADDRVDSRDPEGDPFDRLLLSIQLDEALRRLSPEHRHAVVEVYYQGRTCADLGRELGIPASTARSRLYYGVRALRLILEENGGLAS